MDLLVAGSLLRVALDEEFGNTNPMIDEFRSP
jgi:hypothetical protein